MIESLLHSFHFAWSSFTTFISQQPFLFVIIVIIFLRSTISQIIKNRLKKKYIIPYERAENVENRQFYIKYYQRLQTINIIGVILWVLLFFVYLLTKDQVIWTVLAVGVWAILLTFQTFTVSFFTYFLLIKNYKIWDTIRVGSEKIQWEILYIKLLYLGISGKNDFGEHTGEFFIIPNYQVWMNPITKVDLALDHYAKESLMIIFDPQKFTISFDQFSGELQQFLDNLFPLKSASEVSYFKSYIGVRYKMDFTYDNEWRANVWIGFVEKRSLERELKKKILTFVEKMKKAD